jgi:hypothetical protein
LLFHCSESALPVHAGIQCLRKEGGELIANSAGKQIGGECPVLKHLGSAEIAISNGISGLLFPLTALVAEGGNDHLTGDIQGLQINGGKVGRHGLILFGILDWVERTSFYEFTAFNAEIIVQDTWYAVFGAGFVARCA